MFGCELCSKIKNSYFKTNSPVPHHKAKCDELQTGSGYGLGISLNFISCTGVNGMILYCQICSSYVLGSASQVVAAEGPKEQPVTLEYRGIVEQQLAEVIYCCCFSLSVFSVILLLWDKMSHLLSRICALKLIAMWKYEHFSKHR